ncbi:MAG: triose-phosphate isomerase [Patescibacteria group bacterium]
MKKLIIANWKLNPTTLKDAQKLASAISIKAKNTVVLCPPTVYLSSINYPNVGSQDCFWQDKGAHTGQVSPAQLKDLGIKYCIIGHSEKREVGESDEMINVKLKACLAQKIIPVLCVGFGTTVEQDDLEVVDILKQQLAADLAGVDAIKVIVAYEQVWAIGTGNVASPDHAEKISLFIKNKYKVSKVLYGGSVNAANAKEFLSQPNVGGLLVGGASLNAKDFNQIIDM